METAGRASEADRKWQADKVEGGQLCCGLCAQGEIMVLQPCTRHQLLCAKLVVSPDRSVGRRSLLPTRPAERLLLGNTNC